MSVCRFDYLIFVNAGISFRFIAAAAAAAAAAAGDV